MVERKKNTRIAFDLDLFSADDDDDEDRRRSPPLPSRNGPVSERALPVKKQLRFIPSFALAVVLAREALQRSRLADKKRNKMRVLFLLLQRKKNMFFVGKNLDDDVVRGGIGRRASPLGFAARNGPQQHVWVSMVCLGGERRKSLRDGDSWRRVKKPSFFLSLSAMTKLR